MNKEIRGLLMFLGAIGLAYAALLLLVVVFTGAKIMKTVVIITTISTMLFTTGITPQVKARMKQQVQAIFTK